MYVRFGSVAPCDGFDLGSGIGRTAREAHCPEQVDVIDIIPDVTDVIECDTELVANLLCGLQFGQTVRINFGADPEVEVLEFEFLGAGFDYCAVLGGQDAARDARLLQQDHAHAVIDTEPLEHFAFGGVIHTSVRKTAIHIGEE